jgi:hypothetical protein
MIRRGTPTSDPPLSLHVGHAIVVLCRESDDISSERCLDTRTDEPVRKVSSRVSMTSCAGTTQRSVVAVAGVVPTRLPAQIGLY